MVVQKFWNQKNWQVNGKSQRRIVIMSDRRRMPGAYRWWWCIFFHPKINERISTKNVATEWQMFDIARARERTGHLSTGPVVGNKDGTDGHMHWLPWSDVLVGALLDREREREMTDVFQMHRWDADRIPFRRRCCSFCHRCRCRTGCSVPWSRCLQRWSSTGVLYSCWSMVGI
jgi:hypothetical protein